MLLLNTESTWTRRLLSKQKGLERLRLVERTLEHGILQTAKCFWLTAWYCVYFLLYWEESALCSIFSFLFLSPSILTCFLFFYSSLSITSCDCSSLFKLKTSPALPQWMQIAFISVHTNVLDFCSWFTAWLFVPDSKQNSASLARQRLFLFLFLSLSLQ